MDQIYESNETDELNQIQLVKFNCVAVVAADRSVDIAVNAVLVAVFYVFKLHLNPCRRYNHLFLFMSNILAFFITLQHRLLLYLLTLINQIIILFLRYDYLPIATAIFVFL